MDAVVGLPRNIEHSLYGLHHEIASFVDNVTPVTRPIVVQIGRLFVIFKVTSHRRYPVDLFGVHGNNIFQHALRDNVPAFLEGVLAKNLTEWRHHHVCMKFTN